MQDIVESSDVVIVGGGLAGLCAAVAAGRLGAKVTLLTNRPMLGGNSSSEIRVWVAGGTAHGAQRFSRETGIMGELFLENQYRNPEGNPVLWDRVLLDMVRSVPSITLYLNTDVNQLLMDGRTIISVTGWQMDTEKRLVCSAPLFIDASGDGILGRLSRADYTTGRESRHAYGELWAPEKSDHELLGSSLFFYTKNTGKPVRFIPPDDTIDIVDSGIASNKIIRSGDNGCDYWWIEYGGDMDTIADDASIRDKLWSIVFGIWDYIKNSGHYPEASNLTLEWVGMLPGKRESRRFLGDYVLRQQDVIEQRTKPDAVCFGGWSVDLHPTGGVFSNDAASRQRYGNGVYDIPFRSLYSRNISNLLFAGRDISATHIAMGSTRVMATCAGEGQAVGTAAALCVRHGMTPRELGSQRIGELQQTLAREDAPIMGIPDNGDEDPLRHSTVTASSTQRRLSTGDDLPPIDMDSDYALVLPADVFPTGIDFVVDAQNETSLNCELWDSGLPQDYVPVNHIESHTATVPKGIGVIAHFDFSLAVRNPCNAVIIIRRSDNVSLHTSSVFPYGTMTLRRKTATDRSFDDRIPDEPDELLTQWQARPMRGKSLVYRVGSPTTAYLPSTMSDGYNRPFGAPHLWMSALPARPRNTPTAMESGIIEDSSYPLHEWVQYDLDHPSALSAIQLVLNDDVDMDLINLHHHLTPYRVIPTLLRDYDIHIHTMETLECGGRWINVAHIIGNRCRMRTHHFNRRMVDKVKVSIHATNGSPYASIYEIRGFADTPVRDDTPWSR